MQQKFFVEALKHAPNGFGAQLPGIVSEAVKDMSVTVRYDDHDAKTGTMFYTTSGVSHSVLAQVADHITARVKMARTPGEQSQPRPQLGIVR